MYKPSAAMKKILGTYGNFAYLYKDGLIVVEKKELKIAKDSYTTIQVWHIIPFSVKWYVRDYANFPNSLEASSVQCLVIHDPKLIANGFDKVEILFNAGSIGTKEKDLAISKVRFTLGYQEFSSTTIYEKSSRTVLYGASIAIQPDPNDKWSNSSFYDTPASIRSGLDNRNREGYSVIVYGEIPETEEESEKLLEVSY